MTGFLDQIVAHAHGHAPVVRLRPRALFESPDRVHDLESWDVAVPAAAATSAVPAARSSDVDSMRSPPAGRAPRRPTAPEAMPRRDPSPARAADPLAADPFAAAAPLAAAGPLAAVPRAADPAVAHPADVGNAPHRSFAGLDPVEVDHQDETPPVVPSPSPPAAQASVPIQAAVPAAADPPPAAPGPPPAVDVPGPGPRRLGITRTRAAAPSPQAVARPVPPRPPRPEYVEREIRQALADAGLAGPPGSTGDTIRYALGPVTDAQGYAVPQASGVEPGSGGPPPPAEFHIHIDRVEVTRPAPPAARSRRPAAAVDHDAYLARRRQDPR